MDILLSAFDESDPNHVLCALPTGFGKTMPMLLLGHLLPPGAGSQILKTHSIHRCYRLHNNDPCASHHDRAAAARRLQDSGPKCYCWQPGEHLELPTNTAEENLSKILKLGLTSKEGFRGRFWGRDGSTSSSYCLQCRVSLFKEGGQRL